MPNRLVNLDVQYISLVEEGANQRRIIFKSQNNAEPDWEKQIDIAKIAADKMMVYGIVYAPDEVDTQGDFATAEDIEKASYGFMKNLRAWQVDKDHSFESEAAFVAESWLIKSPDALFPAEKEGAWAVGIKIEDDSLWSAIKEGKYRALSLAGFAERVNAVKDDEPADEGLFKKFISWLKFQKNKEQQSMTSEEIQKAVGEALAPLAARVEALEGKETLTKEDVTAAVTAPVAKAVQPLQADLEDLQKASPGSRQDKAPIQKDEEDRLVDAIVKQTRREG